MSARDPVPIKFLFLDYWTLEYVRGFERRLRQPEKYAGNPILCPEMPWESTRLDVGSVMRDAASGEFRMWYSTWSEAEGHANYCYATSADGYRWERPALDVRPGTNRIGPFGKSVICDRQDPDPSRRYKALTMTSVEGLGGEHGIIAYVSADGIHWELLQSRPVMPVWTDSAPSLYRDPWTGLYQTAYRLRGADRRAWRSESADFVHWTRPLLCLEPTVGEIQTQFYDVPMTPYGAYVLGWIELFRTWESTLHYGKVDGELYVEMAHSRDGYGWHRTALGEPFIPVGGPDSWESGMIYPASSPVFLEDEIRFYYSGFPCLHGESEAGKPVCIGAASLPPDGFVALRAGYDAAELLTRPFAAHSPEVYVNAAAAHGEVRVAVCEGSSAEPMEGFGLEDCEPIRSDGHAQRVTWPGADPADIANRPIRLKVRARRADLYSVTMPNGAADAPYWHFREIMGRDPMYEVEEW
jgi:hypothetical protein